MIAGQLGSTGLVVSRVGLGLAALGRPGYINLGHGDDLPGGRAVEAMQARAFEVLDRAWEAGVRYVDAARSYGRAEEFLANWLEARGIEPGSIVVGSKWGYTYTAGWRVEAEAHEIKDHSLGAFLRQRAESLDLLGGQLDLYQIHSATLESGVLDDRAVHEALAGLKTEGVRIGLSLSGPRQAEALRRAIAIESPAGGRLFDAVQATWNLLEPSAGPALAEAHAAGLGVIVKEALANGRLTPRGLATLGDRAAAFEAEARRLGAGPDALALAAALAQPWADVALSGAATVDHLRSNLAAVDVAWDVEAADRLAALAEPPDAYWSARSRMPWN